MKKTMSLLLVLTTLFAALLSGCGKEPEEPEIIEEKVQAQRVTRVLVSGDANDQTLESETVMQYEGDTLRQMSVTMQGKLYQTATFTVNQDRPAVSVICDTDGNTVSTTLCEYDDNGNPLKEIGYKGSELVYTAELRCDENGNVIEEIQDGDQNERIYRTYDEDGKLLSIFYKTKNVREVYTYNEAGDVTLYGYYAGDELQSKIEYLRQEDGTVFQKIHYTLQWDGIKYVLQKSAVYLYSFDDDGRCTGCVVNSNGAKIAEYTYTYDDQGWLCGLEMKGDNGSVTVTIEYDVVSVSKEKADELDDFLDALLDSI